VREDLRPRSAAHPSCTQGSVFNKAFCFQQPSGNDRRALLPIRCYHVFVKQIFQVGIILLLLLAIFGVLLTPDPSDDPAGVTVRQDKSRLLVTSLWVTSAVPLPPITPTSRIMFFSVQVATTMSKRDLICTRLC
jgi:hypothetical protein